MHSSVGVITSANCKAGCISGSVKKNTFKDYKGCIYPYAWLPYY